MFSAYKVHLYSTSEPRIVGCAPQCKVTLHLAHFGESEVVRAGVRVCIAKHSGKRSAHNSLPSYVYVYYVYVLCMYVYQQVTLILTVSCHVCSRIVASALRQQEVHSITPQLFSRSGPTSNRGTLLELA